MGELYKASALWVTHLSSWLHLTRVSVNRSHTKLSRSNEPSNFT